ncbi:hypothetical protein [Kribbella sp. NPDC051620]|uniref:hypothetical protein n=1 Tax=Kribbella sp. NPDC051620 TaxID=3364120 RepID=UPI0037ABA511
MADNDDPDPSSRALGDGLGAAEEPAGQRAAEETIRRSRDVELEPVVPDEEVTEDEPPKPFIGNPVLEPGEPLRMREKTRSRLAMLLAGLVGVVLIANVGAAFRLSPVDSVEQLKDLLSILLPVLVGTLVAYYFPKQQ